MPQTPDQDDTISKLLRLKRYEQPPEGYFDDFLTTFRDRQRAELLRQPAWKIALERVGTFFHELTARQLSYATASAAVLLVATVFTAKTVMAPMDQPMMASVETPGKAPSVLVDRTPIFPTGADGSPTVAARASLTPDEGWFPERDALRAAQQGTGGTATPQPRYILDSRPASYEAPLDF